MTAPLDHAGWRCLGAVHAALLALATCTNGKAAREATTAEFRAYLEGHDEAGMVLRLMNAIEAAIDETIKGATP